jgi:acetylglutamate kinase
MIQQTSFFILVLACFLEQSSSFRGGAPGAPQPPAAGGSTLSLLIEASALTRLNHQATLTSYKDTSTTVTKPWLSTFLEERSQISLSPSCSTANKIITKNDPSSVEIVKLENIVAQQEQQQQPSPHPPLEAHPCKQLMQGSAPYIAQNLGKTVVFHVPGDLVDNNRNSRDASYSSKSILSDIVMTWMLGMRIVVVLGSSSSISDAQMQGDERHHDSAALLRTEVERRLNHCLYNARGGPCPERKVEGNVVGGHFYTAKRVGVVAGSHDDDDQHVHHTGYASHVDADRIHRMLQVNNDIVLLTSQGQSSKGQAISVDGHQLTASVATALNAHKVIFMSKEGSVLLRNQASAWDSNSSGHSSSSSEILQEIPLSFAKSIVAYHNVDIRGQGKAAAVGCEGPAHAVELLNNLVWSAWAVDNDVTSAHIVNPTDGAILEELFSSKRRSNICLYNDKSNVHGEDEDDVEEIVWEENSTGAASTVRAAATTRIMHATAFASKHKGQGKSSAFIR